jgi:DNA-binding NarL/FixJ family response regulator/signal transduction histidine kinase
MSRAIHRVLAGWLVQRALAVNVRVKILGIALGIAAFLGGGTVLFLRGYLVRVWTDDLRVRAVEIARDNASRSTDLLLTNNLYELYALLKDAVDGNPDVRYAFVLDPDGTVLAHTFGPVFPSDLLSTRSHEFASDARIALLQSGHSRLHDVAVPIYDGRVGTLRLAVAEDRMRSQIGAVVAHITLMTALAAAFGIAAAFLLTYLLTQPIAGLLQATEAVGRGDFDHRVGVYTTDEFGALGESFNAMIGELGAVAKQRAQLLKRILTVQEEERSRIAHELHDHTGQQLSALLYRVSVVAEAPTLEAARAQMVDLEKVAATALREVRLLAFAMRPAALRDLGLAAALQHEARVFTKRYGFTVRCHAGGLDSVDIGAEAETAVYRIVREALMNTAHHARADNASVLAQVKGSTLVVIVEDDGVGYDDGAVLSGPVETRFGLLGMAERARLVGASLTFESSPGMGTTVYVELPIGDGGAAPKGEHDADTSVDRPIRVLIADDHAVVRAGLSALLDGQPDMLVVGEAEDGEVAVERVASLLPDVLLLDITMPNVGGLEALKRIHTLDVSTRVLILTMHDDAAYLRQYVQAGAMGYITKGAGGPELLTAIRAVHANRRYLDPSLAEEAVFQLLGPGPPPSMAAARAPLSNRENEVLTHVARGHTNRETAEKLDLSVKTVETYRLRLMQKLDLRSRAELVDHAIREGLLEGS